MSDKVLFLNHEASRTGAPTVLLNLMRWLRRNDTMAFRFVTERAGKLSRDFAALGAADSIEPAQFSYRALQRLDLHRSWRWRHLRRLQSDLAQERFDIIHVNSVASGWLLDCLPLGDCPVVCHVHELTGAIRALGLHNLAALERRKSLYIAVSHVVKARLVSDFAIEANRIEVVHGFTGDAFPETSRAQNARGVLRRQLGLGAGATIACGCGSIEPRKGTDLFLDVARRVLDLSGGEEIHFVWVGGTRSQTREIAARAARRGLSARVHFVGHKVDAPRYFAGSDLFLLTSREDPFPLVVLEAARCGVPTVCFRDGGGAPEFVGDDAGACVPGFDVAEMSRRVLQLSSAPALRAEMGAAARRRAEARHTLEHGAAGIAALMRDAMRLGRGATWGSAHHAGHGSAFANELEME